MIPRLAGLLALCLALWLGGLGLAHAQDSASPPNASSRKSPLDSEAQLLVLLRLPPSHFRSDAGYGGSYGDGPGRAARRRIAERLAHAHGLQLATSWPMPVVGLDCFVMTVPSGRSPADVAAELAGDPAVEWSEPMHVYRGQSESRPAPNRPAQNPSGQGGGGKAGAPNDPLFRFQPAATAWRLADLQKSATGRKVRVAVVDSRVDLTHPDLAGQVLSHRDFLPERPGGPELHGTAVAGIIAAVADNGVGIAGVAPGSRLMALRACWQQSAGATTCDTLSLAKALSFGIENGAQIYNLSFAGPPDRLLAKLLDTAMARGAVVVGAVDPNMAQGGFPASHPGVIAVASEPAGPLPIKAVAAPGRDVPTTVPGGRWATVNGSSYAAAHVSGLVALMRERNARAEPATMLVASRVGGAIDPCASLQRASLQRASLGTCEVCGCPAATKAIAAARP